MILSFHPFYKKVFVVLVLFTFLGSCTKAAPVQEDKKEGTVISVTGVSILRKDLELTIGDIYRLGIRVVPSNATDSRVTWGID